MRFCLKNKFAVLVLSMLLTSTCSLAENGNKYADVPKKEIDPQSGLIVADGMNRVLTHCSACHSTALISQNAMSRERWLETIRWMQKTQKLWPLGDAEPAILDYLSTWYGPKVAARRPPLEPHLMPSNR